MAAHILAALRKRPWTAAIAVTFITFAVALGVAQSASDKADDALRTGARAGQYASCYNRQSLVIALDEVGDYLHRDAQAKASFASRPRFRRIGRQQMREVTRGRHYLEAMASKDCRPLLRGKPPVAAKRAKNGHLPLLGPNPGALPRQ